MQDKQLYLFGVQNNGNESLKKQRLSLPMDILIISGVVFALSLIVAFSLGVERGKRIGLRSLSSDVDTVLAEKNVEENKEAVSEVKEEDKKEELKAEKSELPAKISDTSAKTAKDRQRYNIQVASFRRESAARREAEYLRNKGYPVSIRRKGRYTVVYVGEFEDVKEAESKLKLLRKRYKDCILRRM